MMTDHHANNITMATISSW